MPNSVYNDLIKLMTKKDYGLRTDSTMKGRGYLGEIPLPDGRVATELSVGVNIGGKEMIIPAIVPTLSSKEIDYIRSGKSVLDNEGIMNKAVEHAKKRLASGLSPYYD